MCGIIGRLEFNSERPDQDSFRKLTGLLAHRGPDAEGFYFSGPIALGHRRLSIIDVDSGQQPYLSDDGRFAIVFNGEIYNYLELKKDLEAEGCRFRTHSDTEVLLALFMREGADALNKLNGMFAFAVWDEKTRTLFCARDRLGIKPFYYFFDSKTFMFASELTPLLKARLCSPALDVLSLSNYLSYWHICEPATLYEQFRMLPPASYGVAQGGANGGAFEIKTYWEPPSRESSFASFAAAKEQLDALLQDATKLQIRSDVPYGTFLSGGIDSGLVTALVRKQAGVSVKAFGIGFEQSSYDELGQAQMTADRCGVELIKTTVARPTPDLIVKIIHSLDEPLGNASYVPTYLLAKLAREHVKVVLTGDGGDEVFGGYPTYQAPIFQSIYRHSPSAVKALAAKAVGALPVSHDRISLDYRLRQFMRSASQPYDRAHLGWREILPIEGQRELLSEKIISRLGDYDPLSVGLRSFDRRRGFELQNQLMFADLNVFLLNDHLRKVDRMTMAHGLEARVPLLDHRVVEFGMSLPAKYKVTLFKTKKILKEVARSYLPKQIIDGKKKGLTSPIAHWISEDFPDFLRDSLQGGWIDELFKPAEIQRIFDEHLKKRADHSRLLWGLLTLQIWHERL